MDGSERKMMSQRKINLSSYDESYPHGKPFEMDNNAA